MSPAIAIDRAKLDAICHRWQISELALFGSAITDAFRADSDVDLLVSFQANANWSLLDHTAMQAEFAELFGRPVDLVSRKAIERSENWIRRREILTSAEPIYVAG